MDKYQLISSVIVQVNSAVGLLLSGQYMAWMGEQQDIISKLTALKNGLKKDDQEYEQTIQALKEQLEAVKGRTDTTLNGGTDDGSN